MRIQFALISAVALLAACSNADKAKDTAAGSAGTTASTSTAAATPAPKPGLWEQTVSGGPMSAPMTVKMCVGETPPGENPFAGQQSGGPDCTQSTTGVPGGAQFHSTCNVNGMTVVSDGKVTGAMDTAYKVEITTKTSGPNVPAQMADMKMTIDARRLGDCPAGAAPNSVVQ